MVNEEIEILKKNQGILIEMIDNLKASLDITNEKVMLLSTIVKKNEDKLNDLIAVCNDSIKKSLSNIKIN